MIRLKGRNDGFSPAQWMFSRSTQMIELFTYFFLHWVTYSFRRVQIWTTDSPGASCSCSYSRH